MYRSGSASMAYDLPPPALPPYNTSRSPAARKSVCGPVLGLNTTLRESSSSTRSTFTTLGS